MIEVGVLQIDSKPEKQIISKLLIFDLCFVKLLDFYRKKYMQNAEIVICSEDTDQHSIQCTMIHLQASSCKEHMSQQPLWLYCRLISGRCLSALTTRAWTWFELIPVVDLFPALTTYTLFYRYKFTPSFLCDFLLIVSICVSLSFILKLLTNYQAAK